MDNNVNINNISNLENQMENLDNLLLDIILEDENNLSLTQNTIEMSANYIQTANFGISIPLAKEQAFVQSTQNGFWSLLASKGMYYFIGAIFTAASIITFNNYNNPKANNIIPLISQNDSVNERNYENEIFISQAKEANLSDCVQTQVNVKMHPMELQLMAINKENNISQNKSFKHNTTKNTQHQSGRLKEFDTEFANILELEKADDIKIITKDYHIFNYLYNISIKGEKDESDSLNPTNIPVYEGEPFNTKKIDGLKNLTYISITADAYSENNKYANTQAFDLKLPKTINYYIPKEEQRDLNKFFTKRENQELLNPFYISNTEISNINYHEFLNWVKAYNGFADYNYLERDTINDHKYEKSKAFKYTFYSKNKEVIEHFGSNIIDVYPNEAVWINDFDNKYNEPLVDFYLNHPAYNNYPVVGVSYWQALAYLDWLQYIWQRRMDKQGINYNIEFDLPTAYEWEMAANKNWESAKCENIPHEINDELICNLNITKSSDIEYRKSLGIITKERSVTPTLIDINNSCAKKSKFYQLYGNVSEWLKEDYNDEWQNYKSFLSKEKKSDSVNVWQAYFDKKCNNKNGKLVMGANWYDRRVPSRNSNYYSAMFAKAFIDPSEQHSTIGFRYVIRVKLKDEAKQVLKVNILGRNMPKVDYSNMKLKGNDAYQDDPSNCSFIPLGSFKASDEKTISVQAFYAQIYETNNLSWLLFLNYLIDNNRYDDLKVCIPIDKDWAAKMKVDINHQFSSSAFDDPYYKTLISKKCIKKNGIHKMQWTRFASIAIVGISYEAAQLYARWISEIYGEINDFRIPSEYEWEYMAKGGNNDNPYPWNGENCWNLSSCDMTNFKTDGSYNNPYYIDNICPIGHYYKNDYGLYDIGGNVAEMVADKPYTKGGSFNSEPEYIKIKSKEAWDGKAAPTVGFRLITTYLGNTSKKKSPPGTVMLNNEIYIDISEVRNIDYREYTHWTMRMYGKQSNEYKSVMPDTTVMGLNNKISYFRHPAYRDYPVVGVSYEQAIEYCKWRSDMVNLYIAVKKGDIKHRADGKYKEDIPKVYEYSLPTQAVYDKILRIPFSEAVLSNAKTEQQPLYNYRKANETADNSNPKDINLTAPVYAYWPNILGLYNVHGNLMEMTDKKGIARGGSFRSSLAELESNGEFSYEKPRDDLGFRCVCIRK